MIKDMADTVGTETYLRALAALATCADSWPHLVVTKRCGHLSRLEQPQVITALLGD